MGADDIDIVKLIVGLFVFAGLMIIMFFFVGVMQDKTYYERDLQECRDYQTYGYVTEWQGSCNSFFDCEGQCLVYMNDGTKLPLKDFKTMAIKEAMVR